MSTNVTPDFSGKTILVTGASRGIGAAVAKAFAAAGAHVVLLARTVGALEEIDDEIRAMGGSATLLPQDLSSLDALDSLGPVLATRFGGLDAVVANAGMLGLLTPVAHVDAKLWQDVMNVNFHANFRLIRTLDPLLRAASHGRAVFVTSAVAESCPAYWGPYAVSKAAMAAMVKTYAAETARTNLRVNLIDPGPVDTKMLQEAFPGGYQGQMTGMNDLLPAFFDLVAPDCVRHGETVSVRAALP